MKERIAFLDFFRFIAILSVILFHYFSRWIPPMNDISLYPYGSKYNYFHFGYLGVHFFFMISGFVISFTLTQCESIGVFLKRRFIRLFPAMLVITVLTFVFIALIDKGHLFPDAHKPRNILVSLSFLPPVFLHRYLSPALDYISGSYWSLWPEIQFYVLAGILYFIYPKRFALNILLISIVMLLLWDLFLEIADPSVLNIHLSRNIIDKLNFRLLVFNIFEYMAWFGIGCGFYSVYTKLILRKQVPATVLYTMLALCILVGINCFNKNILLYYLIMLLLFFVFIYFKRLRNNIVISFLSRLGKASYSTYLLHEYAGVCIIYYVGFGYGINSIILPLSVIVFMFGFTYFLELWIIDPIMAKMRGWILPKRPVLS